MIELDVSEPFCGEVHLAIRTTPAGWQTSCTGAAVHTGRPGAEITCSTCRENAREEVAGDPVCPTSIEELLSVSPIDTGVFGHILTTAGQACVDYPEASATP